MADLKLLVREAMSLVTPENWMQAIQHAERLQEEDTQQDIAVAHLVESFIVNITESSEEEFSD